MKFKDMLAEKTGLPAEILPNSYQVLGDILLLKLMNKKALARRKEIGSAILRNFPYVKSVCLMKGISGELRKPRIEIIAGKGTETVHHELNCAFKLDVSKIMWSKGNHEERKRMISLVKKPETIVDMFGGIGYWVIPIAKHTKAKHLFAIEKNKISFNYLEENIRLNRISNITPILGDCRDKINSLPKADRIIMGYFPDTIAFLPYAFKISQKGTVIHLHELGKSPKDVVSKIQKTVKSCKVKAKISGVRVVKSYSASKNHYVFDILCV
ncbi:MAG: class I SAM-dependent methyltransferase family protein [archaeon]